MAGGHRVYLELWIGRVQLQSWDAWQYFHSQLTKIPSPCSIEKIRNPVFSGEETMSEFLQIGSNGQVILPAAIRRKANVQEGDLFKAIVEDDGSIRLVPKTAVERKLVEQYQLKDISWSKQKKGSKR